MGRNI